jgi:hypothetical protein
MGKIEYWNPVGRAWNRMVQVLFRPFNLSKWMTIGFTAFLANCGRNSHSGSSSGGNSGSSNGAHNNVSCADVVATAQNAITTFWAEHAHTIMVVGSVVIVAVIALIVLTNWLNSRGQFMFLDNVMKNRGAVREPWHTYKKEAHSLMLFQITFGVLMTLLSLAILAGIALSIYPMLLNQQIIGNLLGSAIGLIFLLIALSMISAFVQLIASHFVVPLMYQRNLSVTGGFSAFAPIFKHHFWKLALFGLIMSLLNAAAGVAIIVGVLLTCCTALLLLIIPYIGTVALLPIFVFTRFVGPEFMRQFGDEYDLLKEFPCPPISPPEANEYPAQQMPPPLN